MDDLIASIVVSKKSPGLVDLLEYLHNKMEKNSKLMESVVLDLIDNELLEEIRNIMKCGDVGVYFGKTLKDLKIVIQDDSRQRNHEIFLQYKGPKKLVVSKVNLPHYSVLDQEYRCLEEVIEIFRNFISKLSGYFGELECIDSVCTVMEPINATFKDDFRRIYLDDRTWLHIEVTLEGLARNIHLVGQSEFWNNKLQTGLLTWDHDKSIVDNILTIFGLSDLPKPITATPREDRAECSVEPIVCPICLCSELPDVPGVPQPLCQNAKCGVFYHRSCLYQWLVMCAGNLPPAFGVATGTCPNCQLPITCSEKDN